MKLHLLQFQKANTILFPLSSWISRYRWSELSVVSLITNEGLSWLSVSILTKLESGEWRQWGLILQCKCHSASVVCIVARCSAQLISWSLDPEPGPAWVPQWNQKNDLWRNENECQVTWGELGPAVFLYFFIFSSLTVIMMTFHIDQTDWPGEQEKIFSFK